MGTRTARMMLAPRPKPYFRSVTEGVLLGYRRSTVPNFAGRWSGRHYLSDGRYEDATLATADDLPHLAADGEKVMTFAQAEVAVREWARKRARKTGAAEPKAETVRSVVGAYIDERVARDPKAGRDAKLRLEHHIFKAPIADVPLLEVTDKDLKSWRAGLKRGGRARKGKEAPPLAHSTLARLLNDFRAALNEGARKAKASPDLLLIIKDGLRGPKGATRVREKQVLPEADVRRLVEAAEAQDQDFGALVLLLAATGARFDQIARVTVADFQLEARRVMVPVTAKGSGEKQVTHIPVPLTNDVLTPIRSLITGRSAHHRLLLRWHHRQVHGDQARGIAPVWERVERRPWMHASQMTRQWVATLAAAEMPENLVPYCLRHSSIVRQLRAGLPVSLVAKVHDTSAAMIQKHCGAFIVDVSEKLLRQAAVPLASGKTIPLGPTA